jgi:hypothetical protein
MLHDSRLGKLFMLWALLRFSLRLKSILLSEK